MDKLWISGELADLGEQRPAINFQVWSLLSFQERQAPYSFTFALPDTPQNRRLLGFPIMGGQTTVPYTRTPAMYEHDGTFLVTTGGYIILESFDENGDFTCTLYGGAAEFWAITKEAKLSDLTTLGHYQWKLEEVISGGYQKYWPIIDWNEENPTSYIDDNPDPIYGGMRIDFRTLYPGAFLKDIIEAIFTENGYEFWYTSAPVWTDTKFARMFVPCITQKASNICKAQMELAWVQRVSVGAIGDDIGPILTGNLTWYWNRISTTVQNFENLITEEAFGMQTDCVVYNVRSKGTYGLHVTLAVDWDAGALSHSPAYTVAFSSDSGATWKALYGSIIHILPAAGSQSMEVNQNVYISEPGKIVLSIYAPAWEGARSIRCGVGYFKIELAEPEETAYYHDFDIALNLPDITQAALLKLWLNMTCAMLWVNEESKKVYVSAFSELYTTPSEDWSAYFDRIVECKYHLENYGQKSWLRYGNDDTVPEATGDQVVTISDVALEEDVDILTLDFGASTDLMHGNDTLIAGSNGITCAKIALRKAGDPSNSINPRILLNDNITLLQPIQQYDGIYTSADTPLYIAKFDGLDFGTLLQEYHIELLTRVVAKSRIVRANFLLPASVVKLRQTRPQVPIYVKQLNGMFYCDVIENYVAGEMCTVQLIRL
jgi:hypothetical protein